jgi:small-conductance mechanosensitive channel
MISIISVGVAILGLVFSTIWNIVNAKRNNNNDYQNIIQLIKKESVEQGESKMLFQQMNNSLQQIVEDNKRINERIYNLTERLTLVEHDQHSLTSILGQISLLDNKVNKANQRIDIIEHDLKITEKNI